MTTEYDYPPIGAIWRNSWTWFIQTTQGPIRMSDQESAVQARMFITDYFLYTSEAVKVYIARKLNDLGIDKP